MEPSEASIDELIAAGAELGEQGGVFDRLARVTARSGGAAGIEVEVNLDGMIIGLDLTHEALRLGADALAEEIFRLTQQAAAAAVAAGAAILAPVAGDELMSLIDLGGPEPVAVPPATPAEEDFSAVRSWAV